MPLRTVAKPPRAAPHDAGLETTELVTLMQLQQADVGVHALAVSGFSTQLSRQVQQLCCCRSVLQDREMCLRGLPAARRILAARYGPKPMYKTRVKYSSQSMFSTSSVAGGALRDRPDLWKYSGSVCGAASCPASQASQRSRRIQVTEPRATMDGTAIGGCKTSTSARDQAQYSE